MNAIQKYLKQRGLKPTLQIFNNECPELMKQSFKKENIIYQLVPPNLHRNNATEKEIGPFKDYLIAIICSCNPHFPMHI